MERGSGLLVHITSLPSPHGIGTFGSAARRFIRFLVSAKQKYWQILPLNPTGFADSPYQSFSAFALNPYFIDLNYLVKDGFLSPEEVRNLRGGNNASFVNYGKIYQQRFPILEKAYQRGYPMIKEKVDNFYRKHKFWLEDYAVFMMIKKLHNDVSWQEWPHDEKFRKKAVIEELKDAHKDLYQFYIFTQYLAYKQYASLRNYAKRKGIKIIGDIPIYVSADSADVWAHPSLFLLDKKRRPTEVAGVPPDYFAKDGQLWGNPLYNWERMKKDNYLWWRRRFDLMSKLYDLVRVDHFRAFDTYWAVKFGEKTARNGVWKKGPGSDFFITLEPQLKKIQIIAEDLGILTDSAKELKAEFNFPGIKLYQFGFDDYQNHLRGEYGEDYEKFKDRLSNHYDDVREDTLNKLCNAYLPHNYEENCVAYLGAHDNDVMTNYLDEHPYLYDYMLDYLQIGRVEDILDTLIGSLMRSNADVVIFQIQDILHMGKESRMNVPGKPYGNWTFRFRKKDFSRPLAEHLAAMVTEAGR